MRTKKIFLNMLSDIIPYLLIGIVGLIKVKFLVTYIGDVGNGYYQTINQIITYVFLAEVGFGDAVTYSLYKAFAKNNQKEINEIYSGSRKIFKKIGYIILGIIFLVTLLLGLFYNFETGYKTETLLCFLIISTSYLIAYFGKGQTFLAILSANQSKYIHSLVFNSIKLLCDIGIILVVLKFSSLTSIAIVILLAKIIEEIIIRIVMKKKYPWLKTTKKANTKMFKMTKDLAGIQIGRLILNNTDSLIIVSFLGPISVSIYTSYMVITRFLNEISAKVELSMVNSFGNVFANKETKKIYPLFKEMLILFTILAFAMMITFTLGIRGFINIWIGKEEYLVNYQTVTLFALSTFLYTISLPLLAIINANGCFKENKNQTFACALTNIISSLILVKIYNLNGLLIGTVLAFLLNLILKIILIEKKFFKKTHHKITLYYLIILLAFLLCLLIMYPIEETFLLVINTLPRAIFLLGSLFISLLLIMFGLSCILSQSARLLYERVKKLLTGGKKKWINTKSTQWIKKAF